MNKTIYTLFFIVFASFHLVSPIVAQEMVLVVERCKALNQKSPINNIWVDEENIKWVSNGDGLHKVLAIDLVQKVSIPAGTTSLLTIRGGNANIEWSTSEMQSILGGVEISSASYDPSSKTIWIGTQREGAFQVAMSPLRVLQQFNMKNKKLTSNQINDIYIQRDGKVWIATDDGMLSGKDSKWSLEERYLNFVGVDAWGDNLWILGDDFLWQVDSRGKWNPIAIELKNVEGKLRDIAVDARGRVWIASNMMTGYDVELTKYQEFGPAQYFTSQYVNCLDVDKDGSIWTGTDDKGLYLIQWESAMTVNIVMEKPIDCKTLSPVAELSARVIGGEAPRVYQWSTGASTEKVTGLAAGKYAVSVTDGKGLLKTAEYEIPDPSISISIEVIKPSSGSSEGDASINVLVNGGTGQMTYKWDNGESTQLAEKLTSGIHAVTVTDENGCSATTSFEVTEKVLPLSVTLEVLAQNKCANGAIGEIEAIVSGGKPPILYQWSENGAIEKKLTNRTVGEYSVTVADAAGQTATAITKITAPPALEAYFENISSAKLGVDNGQAQVNVAGGKEPYSYAWDNGATTKLVKNLSSGRHTMTITDANGCTDVQSIDILEDIDMLGVLIKDAGSINCAGQATGALRLDISGGKGPFTYVWSNGQTTANADKLTAGSYTVTVTDAVGSTFSASFEVTEPAPVTLNASADAPSSTNGLDGKASVKASGGTGAYSYAWDNGEKENKASKLPAGMHTVTVTDAAGCSSTATVMISENILALGVIIGHPEKIKCAGAEGGVISAEVKGGKGPYTYAWSNGQTNATIENLKAGTYTVTVTDVVGGTFIETFEVSEPSPVTAIATVDAPSSTNGVDGKASVKASGGSGPYQYAWDNGEVENKATKLIAGLHTVTITDASGCTATTSVEVSENILELSVTLEQTQAVKCAGTTEGVIDAIVKGGKEPFIYSWSNGSTSRGLSNVGDGLYTITVSDVTGHTATSVISIDSPKPMEAVATVEKSASTNQKDGKANITATGGTGKYSYAWDTGELTAKAAALGAGTHSVTVTDENGCSVESSVVITENILPLTVTLEQTTKIKCAGSSEGMVSAIVGGGKQPFTYAWNTGSSIETISNIGVGSYTLTVTDVAGNTATSLISVESPKPLETSISIEKSASTNQKDGKATITATGGTGKYSYAWDTGELAAKAAALGAGTHTVTVTDENGCTVESSVVITENILPLAVTLEQASEIKCAGQTTGALNALVTGGKPPYSIQWKGPGKTYTSESISQLAAGQYAMQVEDVNGTSATASFEIKEPNPLVVTAEDISPANTGDDDGSVTLKVSGGTGKYTLEGGTWPSGALSKKLELLKPGEYTYTVEDEAGCSAKVSVTITEDILPLSVSIRQTQEIRCAGTGTAALEATVKGGKGPFTYTWSNSSAGAMVSNLSDGSYKVTVKDVTGQTAEGEFIIEAPKKLVVEAANLRSATNDRIKDGKGQVEIKGGTGPFSYQWSSGETTDQASQLPLGTGNVVVTDANGCSASTSFEIKEKVLPELTAARLSSGEPIRMEKIQFDADSIVIREDAKSSIDELYEFLYDNPTIIIEVSGHTNGLPADDYCDRISTERAQSVKDYLVNKGIEDRRVISIGYGKRKPIATNQTPEGRKRNQRVEIRLIKIEE